MANEIIRLQTANIDKGGGSAAIAGSVSVSFGSDVEERLGQSDAEIGVTSDDIVIEGLAGELIVSDEEFDLIAMTGGATSDAVGTGLPHAVAFGGTFKIAGGTSKTITIGKAASITGIFFTEATFDYDTTGGPTIQTRLSFVGKFPTTATKLWGDTAAEVTTTEVALIHMG